MFRASAESATGGHSTVSAIIILFLKKKKLECILRNFPITEFQGKNQENSKRSYISKSCSPSRKFFATQVSTLGGMHMLIME